jgi:hypothetical protein
MSSWFDISPPTAARLIERLREVYADKDGSKLSDEKLAGKLPITLSTFNRWKKSDTKAFRDMITMLDAAGWLQPDAAEVAMDPAAPHDPLEALVREVAEIARMQALIAEHLGVAPADSAPREAAPSPQRAPARRKPA